MIDQLLAHRDSISYAIAISSILLSMIVGYLFGYQSPEHLCAEYIVEAEQLTQVAHECNTQRTQCESKQAGGAVLSCAPICAKQVADALKNHTDIICED